MWTPGTEVTYAFGFIGIRETPVAADMDRDGIDDLGLWVPDRAGVNPEEDGEWYFLISAGTSVKTPDRRRRRDGGFKPVPVRQRPVRSFGDEFAVPVVGNFDPPTVPTGGILVELGHTNPDNAADVNGDGS